MTKEQWIVHMETTENILRPSMGGDLNAWRNAKMRHNAMECPDCKKRAKMIRKEKRKSEKDLVMESLGLVKVRGAVSGKVYWE